MKHNSRHLARRNAVQALYQWDITGQSVGEIENAFINDDAFVGVQRSYFQHLIENVPRQCQVLDNQLKQCISRELDSIDPVERAILRLSTYELLFLPEIPVSLYTMNILPDLYNHMENPKNFFLYYESSKSCLYFFHISK